jgi:hypothetical protein
VRWRWTLKMRFLELECRSCSWAVALDNIYLSYQDAASDRHGDGDDGDVQSPKITSTDVDKFSAQDVTPEEAC